MVSRFKKARCEQEAEYRLRLEELNNECQQATHDLKYILAREEIAQRESKREMKALKESKSDTKTCGRKRKSAASHDQEFDESEQLIRKDYPTALPTIPAH